MSKEDREYYRRLKKMQKHVDGLRGLTPGREREAESLHTIELELRQLRETREANEAAKG